MFERIRRFNSKIRNFFERQKKRGPIPEENMSEVAEELNSRLDKKTPAGVVEGVSQEEARKADLL